MDNLATSLDVSRLYAADQIRCVAVIFISHLKLTIKTNLIYFTGTIRIYELIYCTSPHLLNFYRRYILSN